MRRDGILPLAVFVLIELAILIGIGLSTGEQANAQAQAFRQALSQNNRQICEYAHRLIETW